MLRRLAAATAVASVLVAGVSLPAEARSMQGTRCKNGAPVVLKTLFTVFGHDVKIRGCAW